MTAERSTSAVRASLWAPLLIAAMLVSAPGCSSLYDLVPGHKEAELRDRVQHDDFPTAAQAMKSPSASGS